MKRTRSPLTTAQLRRFRSLLLSKRAELVGDLTSLDDEQRTDDGDLSHMPVHLADAGSDSYQEDMLRRLAEHEREMLFDIDEALVRIANGTYGLCEATGDPIAVERLEAMPWARYTVAAELRREAAS